jgi:hypothetical protein
LATEPLVSCVVTVWNGEKYLAEALDSVFAQTYRAIEVIIVDDGSTDRSRAIITARTGQLKFLAANGAGPVAARNRGIAAAAGDLVAFLDHDDIWAPHKLACQVAAYRQRAGCFACLGHAREFSDRGSGQRIWRGPPAVGNIPSTLMLSRAAICRHGAFDPALRYADATAWLLRARAAGCAETILPDTVTYRRRHAQNLSQLRNAEMRREFLAVLKAHLDRGRAGQSGAIRGVDRPRYEGGAAG